MILYPIKLPFKKLLMPPIRMVRVSFSFQKGDFWLMRRMIYPTALYPRAVISFFGGVARGKTAPNYLWEIPYNREIQQKSWVLPAHDSGLTTFSGTGNTVDLGAASQAFEFAQALYMLGDKLGAKTRALLTENLYKRIFNPVKKSLLTGKTGKILFQ